MSIAADLDFQTCNGSRGELLSHNHCRSAQKAKGRGGHATVTDRHELRLPGNVLFLQQANGVGSVSDWRPFRVAGTRHLLTESPASGTAVSDGTKNSFPGKGVYDALIIAPLALPLAVYARLLDTARSKLAKFGVPRPVVKSQPGVAG